MFIHAKIPPSVLSTKAENMSLKICGCAGGWETTCDTRKKLQYRIGHDISIQTACTIFLGHFWVNHSYICIKIPPPRKCQQRNFGDSNMVLQLPVELRPSSPTNLPMTLGYSKLPPLASTVFQRVGWLKFPTFGHDTGCTMRSIRTTLA